MMFNSGLFLGDGNEKRVNHQGGRAQEINEKNRRGNRNQKSAEWEEM